MNIWFTSDTHYGHANIIKYCNRPFKNIREMDEGLIELHNECVGPSDVVYHLGDFSFSRESSKYLKRLNGAEYHLILGNHDKRKLLTDAGFTSINDVKKIHNGEYTFWLSHYAHLRWPHSHHGAFHLFGHSHGGLEGHGRSMDIGVDTNEYRPWHIDEVIRLLKKKKATEHHRED